MIDVGGAALLGAAARNDAAVAAVAHPGALPDVLATSCATLGHGLGRDAPAPRGRGVRRASPPTTPRSPRYLNHIAGTRFPQRLALVAREGRATCATARTRTSAPRSTARRRTAPAPSPTRPSSQGDPPTFNDLLDLDAAYRIATDFTAPTCCIAKHTDPVGHRLRRRARRGLPQGARDATRSRRSAAIVGVNRELDGATAREIAANSYEAVVAPGFSAGGAGHPRREARPRAPARIPPTRSRACATTASRDLDFQRIGGGLLVETPRPSSDLDRAQLQVVTRGGPRWRS